jgi:benzodiazapine receptor
MNKIIMFIVSVVICQLAGVIGSFFTINSVKTWYTTIAKPSFNPPSWVFGPVWTILFLMMGVALFLVWQKGLDAPGVKIALLIFAVQLVLNILWSIIFFGLKLPLLAFVEILLMWIFILLTIINFYRISHPAGLILIPYILWVSFASVLNLAIFLLNR